MCNVLLGACIGDALGVPFETKLPNYQPLLDWDEKTFLGSIHHNLLPGQYSDDGQMSTCIASSLIENNGFNPEDLAKRYVELFVSNTIRGYGGTTKAAIDNLISGVSYKDSGIIGSLGNGTAMRAAPFGVYFRDDLQSLIEAATIDAKITHNSDEAIAGSLAVALTAYYAVNHDTDDLLNKLCSQLPDSKVKYTICSLDAMVNSEHIAPQQALAVLGTKGDVRQTVPSAIYLFMKMNNYTDAILAAIHAGFDTDTTACITGSLFAARDGIKAIPKDWVEGVEDGEKLIQLDSQLFNRNNRQFFPRLAV